MGLDNIVKIRVKMFDTLFISNIISTKNCEIILNIVFVLIIISIYKSFYFFSYLLFMHATENIFDQNSCI